MRQVFKTEILKLYLPAQSGHGLGISLDHNWLCIDQCKNPLRGG
jgi:hypothetical protein